MRRALSPLLLLVVAGCTDPAASRLPSGSRAITYDPAESRVRLDMEKGKGFAGASFGTAAVGTEVVVVSDEAPGGPERKVRVNVPGEGPETGPASIARKSLRPAR